jgi:hypothetical protein
MSRLPDMTENRYFALAGFILAAAATRLLPHPWNFTPVGAMALFGGARCTNRAAGFLLPCAALFLGDLVLGLHKLMPFIYGCFAVTVCLGFWLRRSPGAGRIVIASLVSSTLFFLVTNAGDFVMLDTYPKNLTGLIQCYVAGLACFRNGILGDLFYCAVLFGALALAERRFTALRETGMAPAST